MDELLAVEAARATKPDASRLDPSSSAMAIVHRTFMPDCSPAAIAVSLPGGHSYCWDAGNCRLRYAWRGGFIKKNGSFSRWRTLPHLEGRVYHRESSFPLSFEGKEIKTMRKKFRGYRLLGGIPEFRYEVGDAEIREFLAKLPGKSGLSRRFFVSNAPSDLLFHLDPDAGTRITCNKGRRKEGAIRLSPEEATDFTITMEEIPKKAPLFYLSMNDLEASYNRKGSLYEGALGQCWQFTGGRRIVPRQLEEKYENNASIAFWLKLTDPMRPIPAIAGWETGETLSYAPNQESFSFGKDTKVKAIPDGGLEAEAAKFEGPTRTNRNGGFMGSGYLDFGEAKGQFVHGSAIMVISPQGTISHYFFGIEYPSEDIRLALIESSENKLGNVFDQVMLYCFNYDPEQGKYGIVIMNSMRVAGLVTLLAMGSFMIIMFKRDRKNRRVKLKEDRKNSV